MIAEKKMTPKELLSNAQNLLNEMKEKPSKRLELSRDALELLKKVPTSEKDGNGICFGEKAIEVAKGALTEVMKLNNLQQIAKSVQEEVKNIDNYINAVKTEETNRIMRIAMSNTYSGGRVAGSIDLLEH